jgi:hypothetical protein
MLSTIAWNLHPFARWRFVSLVYVLAAPETASLSLDHIDALFEYPWGQIRSKARHHLNLDADPGPGLGILIAYLKVATRWSRWGRWGR